MKSLNKYIIESLEKFKATTSWLIERYNKFNEELFNNELPSSSYIKLTVKRSDGNELGCQGFERDFYISSDYMENGMYRMRMLKPGKGIGTSGTFKNGRWHYKSIINDDNTVPVKECLELKPYININDIYVATEHNLEDTLIHEMIHLWLSKDGLEPKQAHGREFKKKCNEIRKLAKTKYGKDYELTTKATNTAEYEFDDKKKDETNKIIQKNKQRGGGVFGVYLILSDDVLKTKWPYNKRFFFCTKNMLDKIIGIVKRTEGKYIKNIYITENSYEKACNEYGIFSTVNKYRFWDINDYIKIEKYLLKDAHDILNESLTESKKSYIKPEIFMYEIPANTNLSDIDLEDIINTKLEDEKEIKGSPEIEKNIITPNY